MIVAVDFVVMVPFGRSRSMRYAAEDGFAIETLPGSDRVRLSKGAQVRDVVGIGHVLEHGPDPVPEPAPMPLPFAPSPSAAPPPAEPPSTQPSMPPLAKAKRKRRRG